MLAMNNSPLYGHNSFVLFVLW